MSKGDLVKVKKIKQSIRNRIWRLMEERNIATFPRPVFGRIPNFKGSIEACKLLATLKIFQKAHVIKVNPDSPQRYIRYLTLTTGKLLIMPSPKMKQGFLLLDPNKIPRYAYKQASTIAGAFKWGIPIDPQKLPTIDLVITGSVAVNKKGARLGKGGGYSELEWAILREVGKVNEEVPVVTTVHEVQIVENEIPVEPHDLPVDMIITPRRVIKIKREYPKPAGIIWDLVTHRLHEIPLLEKLYRDKKP